MQTMLSHDFLETATFPLQAFEARLDIAEDGTVNYAMVESIRVLEYSLSPGASVKTILCKGADGKTFRGSCENYHANYESALEEIEAAKAEAADNPPYATLKQQRDEARALLALLANGLAKLGFAPETISDDEDDEMDDISVSGCDTVDFINRHLAEINTYATSPDAEAIHAD